MVFENLFNMFHYIGVEKPTRHEGTPFNLNQCKEAETTQTTSETQYNQRKHPNTYYFLCSKFQRYKNSKVLLTARTNNTKSDLLTVVSP